MGSEMCIRDSNIIVFFILIDKKKILRLVISGNNGYKKKSVGLRTSLYGYFIGSGYISPSILLRLSIQAPTAPAFSPNLLSFMVVSLFTSCSEYLLMALLSGNMI